MARKRMSLAEGKLTKTYLSQNMDKKEVPAYVGNVSYKNVVKFFVKNSEGIYRIFYGFRLKKTDNDANVISRMLQTASIMEDKGDLYKEMNQPQRIYTREMLSRLKELCVNDADLYRNLTEGKLIEFVEKYWVEAPYEEEFMNKMKDTCNNHPEKVIRPTKTKTDLGFYWRK